MVGGPGVAVQQFARGLIRNRHFAPIDVERVDVGAERDPEGVAIAPQLVALPGPAPLADLVHATRLSQQLDFLIEGWVGVWFAGEDEVPVLRQDQLAERLMAVEIIPQQGHAACREGFGVALEPALGHPQLTILLLATILRPHEFRLQGDDPGLAGATSNGATSEWL